MADQRCPTNRCLDFVHNIAAMDPNGRAQAVLVFHIYDDLHVTMSYDLCDGKKMKRKEFEKFNHLKMFEKKSIYTSFLEIWKRFFGGKKGRGEEEQEEGGEGTDVLEEIFIDELEKNL